MAGTEKPKTRMDILLEMTLLSLDQAASFTKSKSANESIAIVPELLPVAKAIIQAAFVDTTTVPFEVGRARAILTAPRAFARRERFWAVRRLRRYVADAHYHRFEAMCDAGAFERRRDIIAERVGDMWAVLRIAGRVLVFGEPIQVSVNIQCNHSPSAAVEEGSFAPPKTPEGPGSNAVN